MAPSYKNINSESPDLKTLEFFKTNIHKNPVKSKFECQFIASSILDITGPVAMAQFIASSILDIAGPAAMAQFITSSILDITGPVAMAQFIGRMSQTIRR
jgi:hypothetical protein